MPPPPADDSAPNFTGTHQRRLAVIMFTDLVGYSAISQRDENLALHLLEEHRAIVRPRLARHGGREIKTIGDAFLVEFSSALAAASCAIAIQQAFQAHNQAAAPAHRILLRIGLHAGDIIHKGNDVYGDGVNIAARLEPLAEPGGICVSEDVARPIRNKIPFPLVHLGQRELKNISLPVELYRIQLPWSQARGATAARRKRPVLLAGLAAIAAAGAIVAGLTLSRPRPTAAPVLAPVNRLAVLPLANYSGDTKDEYFADGMTEELISSLATIRELDVIARTSVTRFKGTKLDLAEIGGLLHVASVLEGSVRIAGDQARIDIRLVDIASQRTLWTQAYSTMIKDVFAVQSAIAGSVTEALKLKLLSGEKSLIERRGTASGEAYRQYLLGRTHLGRRTGDEVLAAIDCFARSAELDPSFALAYAGLAEGYTLAGSAGYGNLPRLHSNELAREFATKAVALDDSLAEAHAALGYVRFRIEWNWHEAEAEFKRALALKPGNARAHEWYALFLSIQRRLPEALAEMQRAQQLDPLSASVSNGVGRILHFSRRFDEALAQYRRTLELDPNYAEAYFSQAMTYQAMGRGHDAIAAMNIAIPLSGHRPVMVAMLGLFEGLAGNKEAATKIYQDMVALPGPEGVSPYFLGIICIGLHDHDRAFAYFEQALAARDGVMIYLGVEPVTDMVAADPRFASLLERMQLSR